MSPDRKSSKELLIRSRTSCTPDYQTRNPDTMLIGRRIANVFFLRRPIPNRQGNNR